MATPSGSVNRIKRYRTRRITSLITRCFYLYRRKQYEKIHNAVCDEFVNLGGVYVKFLQGVLLRTQFMRRWQSPDRFKIFENLDHEPLDINAILRHELKPDQLAQIVSVQPQPFAAGSFGQVYYAQLNNGQPIIIKVLRPMIRELLKHDLRLLAIFTRSGIVKRLIMKNVDVDVNTAIREFFDATLRETDYKSEVEFACEMYEAYKDHPLLVIPRTYAHLSTTNIIVQDYVGGISVAQLMKLMEQQGVDPKEYTQETLGSDLDVQLQVVGYESLMGIFHLKRVQGDPHPGNIRLLPGNKVGLIDFGISARAPQEKGALFGMLEAYDQMFKGSQTVVELFENGLRFFVSDLYRALKTLATMYDKSGDQQYIKAVGKLAEETFAKTTGTNIINVDWTQDQSVLITVNKIINQNNRFGMIMKLEATDLLRGLQTYVTLVAQLQRYKYVVPPTMHHVVKDVRRLYPNIINESNDQVAIGEALEIISKWLGRVAERDPLLFSQLMGRINSSQELKSMDVKEPSNV